MRPSNILHDKSLPSRYPGEDRKILARDAFVGSDDDVATRRGTSDKDQSQSVRKDARFEGIDISGIVVYLKIFDNAFRVFVTEIRHDPEMGRPLRQFPRPILKRTSDNSSR